MVVNINGNWIKLFSKFMNWEWYKDSNTVRLFIHCLLKANWKDGKFQGIEIPRGSFVTGRKQLAEELGISEQSIRTSINKLKSTNEITTKSTNKFTIITIVNYEKYQKKPDKSTNEITNDSTNEQPTTNQQLTTIEEYIEYKTKKENKENSVCNNTHAEEFNCHLGCIYKTTDCKNCMKKWKCPLPDEPTFKGLHGKTFYEYVAEIELRKLEVAREFERMESRQQDYIPDPELDDYDWLNDKGER